MWTIIPPDKATDLLKDIGLASYTIRCGQPEVLENISAPISIRIERGSMVVQVERTFRIAFAPKDMIASVTEIMNLLGFGMKARA